MRVPKDPARGATVGMGARQREGGSHVPPNVSVALNGSRTVHEHPAIPRTPRELAEAARAAVDAGARSVHIHAYDESGQETLAAGPCAAAIRAVRRTCPGVPLSMTTSAAVDADPGRRLASIEAWTELPDRVTANQGEEGIDEVCDLLSGRGVGIEAGIMTVGDAKTFVRSDRIDRCSVVLVEPLDRDARDALATAAAIERVLADASVTTRQVHHGDQAATWPVSVRAYCRGHGIRTGLEDSTLLPSSRLASDNAEMVRTALHLMPT